MNAITQTEQSHLAPRTGGFDLSPQTFEQAVRFSHMLADSDFVPKDFKGKPGNCLIAMQWGAEIGLKPLQSLQNLAVINGRPALWGDSVIAIVRGSPLCEYVIENDDGHTAYCRVKRRGEPEQTRAFSMDDAKAAGLAGKQGPWVQYPKRMRQMRARAFAMRDVFPDVLRGLPVAEEVMDTPTERHMGQAEQVERTTEPAKPAALPFYPQEQFVANLPTWRGLIAEGRATAEAIIAKASTKGQLTQEQQDAIRAPVAPAVTDVQPKEPARPTYEQVEQRLREARTEDELHTAAGLIDQVGSPADQAALNDVYDTRMERDFSGESA